VLPRLIADFPFVLALVASLLAAASAALLRRAAPTAGRWAAQVGRLLWVLGLAASAWSLIWALSLRIGPGSPGVVTSYGTYGLSNPEQAAANPDLPQLLLGLAALATGGWLAMVVLRERARLGLFTAPFPALAPRLPYRRVRHPGTLAWILLALGLTVLSESLPLWVWFVLWLPTALVLAELGEAEQRRQHPELAEYFRRTPRYLPRRLRATAES
jgi:protein-S-isoprenylcysteine O-methyltransferase Ste14